MTRPYVILKYAQSADGFLGHPKRQVWLTNAVSKRLVHKWRSEIDAIMVGTQTALIDNPRLTNRLYFGKSPLRLVLDRQLRLPNNLHVFDDLTPTRIITEHKSPDHLFAQTQYWTLPFDDQLLDQILIGLGQQEVKSLMIEGGASLLNSFIQQGFWDEIRLFTAAISLGEGVKAPELSYAPSHHYPIGKDLLEIYRQS